MIEFREITEEEAKINDAKGYAIFEALMEAEKIDIMTALANLPLENLRNIIQMIHDILQTKKALYGENIN